MAINVTKEVARLRHMAPLGFVNDRNGRKIVVNADEAAQVRGTLDLYLECRSIIQTLKELDRRGWKNKLSLTKSGKVRGGRNFDKSSLFKLLTDVAYLGKVRYKIEIHDGELEAIVPIELWERVQKQRKHNGRRGGVMVRNKFGSLHQRFGALRVLRRRQDAQSYCILRQMVDNDDQWQRLCALQLGNAASSTT